MESQLGWHPNEDMQMSYAPSFRAPGGHFFDVVAEKLKTHVFMYLLPCLHSMYHRNYACGCGPQGL